ncbi:MAG TPA: LanC-like protein [Kofleriaceae bacterium]
MLWDPIRHEPLIDAAWDEAVAQAGIREIVTDAERAYDRSTLWPQHPNDLPAPSPNPWTGVYCGAAGVALALSRLGSMRDWNAEVRHFAEIYREAPEEGVASPSLMIGEVGILAIADHERDRLFTLIESNIENPCIEWLWGAPGTMLPALSLYERTGEARWRDLYVRCAEHLIRTLEYHADFDVWMWTQQLYGEHVRLLGAAHGFAGNMYALLRGAELLAQQEMIRERATHTLRSVALGYGEYRNWLPHVGTPRSGRDKILLQWCHGAPGMITALANLRNAEVDELLLAGAELTWHAGPLAKGQGLCHGTAGNGYALLAMAARTGDERWLDRARRFAMHALAQVRAQAQRRYSLWTGDLGVALFLRDCIAGAGELPQL